MIVRPLVFSLLASLLSLGIVLFSLNLFPVGEEHRVYSPFWDEINQLLPKATEGMTPEESKYLKELLNKNTHWHEERKKNDLVFLKRDTLESWKRRSSSLAPGIMMIWGALFYFFYRHRPNRYGLLVLIFPVGFTIVGLMSIFECLLITFSVLAIWLWLLFSSRSKASLS